MRWKNELHDNDKEHFFGMFQDSVEEFEFMLGERTILLDIAQYLNKLFVDKGFDSFVKHFTAPQGYKMCKRDTDQFGVGIFFGKKYRQRSKWPQPMKHEIGDITSSLFVKLKKMLEPFREKMHTVRPINADLIKVTDLQPGFRADVLCIFCIGNDSDCETLLKRIAIQNDTKREGPIHWNFSNFRKHINWHISHANKTENTNSCIDHNENGDQTENIGSCENVPPNVEHESIIFEKLDNFDIEQTVCDGMSNSIEQESESLVVCDDNDSQLLVISHIDDSLRDIMIDQFSSQNLLLNESVLVNHEGKIKKSMLIKVGNQSASVKLVKINGDGNCLFGSLVSQLNAGNTNMSEFDLQVKDLRRNVVDYIRENKNRFRYVIKGRILDDVDDGGNDLPNDDDIDKAIDKFIEEKLTQNGYWGGMETIVAVTEMFGVNILVFNENEAAYFPNGFKDEYQRTIFLAYRLSQNSKSEAVYNHYDSICDIPVEIMYKLACKFGQ